MATKRAKFAGLSPAQEQEAGKVLHRLRGMEAFPATIRELVDELLPPPYGEILCEPGPYPNNIPPGFYHTHNVICLQGGVVPRTVAAKENEPYYKVEGIAERFWFHAPWVFPHSQIEPLLLKVDSAVSRGVQDWARRAVALENQIEQAMKVFQVIGIPGNIAKVHPYIGSMTVSDAERLYAKALMLPEPSPLVSWVEGAGHG